jgi:DNA-binding response OmpR family regulator
MRTILVIDDDPLVVEYLRVFVENRNIEFVAVQTIEEAERVFENKGELFAAICIDACVPGNKPNTVQLAKKIRSNYRGPMIAISSVEKYRLDLMRYGGCSHQSPKDSHLAKFLVEFFWSGIIEAQ